MNNHILIAPNQPENYYLFFYLLAFLIGYALLIREGYKRDFPLIPWMLVVGTSSLFFILGCRAITFSGKEWQYVWQLKSVPYDTGLSVLGGILFSIPSIYLAKTYLRFNNAMVDSFAFTLPVALMIQRFGCLMAGCCYGTISNVPWAIQYSNESHAFTEQSNAEMIVNSASQCLPVHPVQFYEVLGCIVLVVFLLKLRTILKGAGSLLMASTLLYGILRFILEFFRATGGHSVGGRVVFHLNLVQWSILLIVPLLFFLLRRNELKWRTANHPDFTTWVGGNRPVLYFFFLAATFLFVSRWMSPFEMLVLNVVFVPTIISIVVYLFRKITVPRYRLASLFLPLSALLLMSQTVPTYIKKDSARYSYTTLGFGLMAGSTRMQYGASPVNCNGPLPRAYYDNNYSATAYSISHTIQQGEKSTIFSLNYFNGTHSEGVGGSLFPISSTQKYSTWAISPYMQLNRPNFGVGFGLNSGELVTLGPTKEGALTSVSRASFSPAFSLRVGALSKGFLEYKFAKQFPTAFPSLNHQLALGFGTTKRDRIWRGGGFRIGTASNTALFVSTSTILGKRFVLDGFFGFGTGLLNSYQYTESSSSMGSISLRYKIYHAQKK